MSAKGHDRSLPSDEAFDRWYGLHFDRLRALCSRVLKDPVGAEDIAQEALLRAWVSRDQLRDEDVGAWLSVVARNLCISSMRKDWRSTPTETLPEITDLDADPAVQVATRESRKSVRSALARMGERHRNVLYLHEVSGADYEELGSRFGLTAAGARTVAFRARRALREHLVAVGEGFSGILAGVRVTVRDLRMRARTAMGSLDSNSGSAMQAGVNLALAVGVTVASLAGSSALAGASPSSRSEALAAVPAAGGGRVALQNPGGAPVEAGVEYGPGRHGPGGSGLVPGGKVKPLDIDDKRTDVWIYVGGRTYHAYVNGQDGDGLDPAYRGMDAAFEPVCGESPGTCQFIEDDHDIEIGEK